GDGILEAGEGDADAPPTYFASDGDIKGKIYDVISEILTSSASGTSVSVLSTSAGGEGGLYQAYFYPRKQHA
ncbi:MAG: hypothetical protein GWN87_26565, partial [Desulfuromonadales bacterium]|nr:hypothetical protein [Desulfuromonadales bacterium]NIS43308.1 hypothetical protein [Desulfuromonadales bacterium]